MCCVQRHLCVRARLLYNPRGLFCNKLTVPWFSSQTYPITAFQRARSARLDASTLMLLLLPLLLPSWQHSSASLRERPSPQRMAPPLSRRHALSAAAAAALGVLPGARPASAAYGDFAKMGTDAGTQGVLAAGDPNNECLFATPGTGLCQVPPPPLLPPSPSPAPPFLPTATPSRPPSAPALRRLSLPHPPS